MKKICCLVSFTPIAIALAFAVQAFADSPSFIPADSIEQPSSWTSSNSDKQLPDGTLEVVGNGATSSWLSNPIAFESRKLYSYRFKAYLASSVDGSECACCGPEFANFDINGLPTGSSTPKEYDLIVFTPDGTDGIRKASARFAQWESKKTYRYYGLEISPVLPVFSILKNKNNDLLTLGAGESLDANGVYRFDTHRSSVCTNYESVLYSSTANFNTDRWVFGENSTLVFRFVLKPNSVSDGMLEEKDAIPFVSGTLSATVGYYTNGSLAIEASYDGETWTLLSDAPKLQSAKVSLNDFLASKPKEFFVRLRGKSESESKPGCNFQVGQFSIELQTEQSPDDSFVGVGETCFATLSNKEVVDNAPDAYLWGIDEVGNVFARSSDSNKIFNLEWNSDLLKQLESESSNGNEEAFETYAPKNTYYQANFKRPEKLSRRVFPYFIQDYTKTIAGLKTNAKGFDLSWCDSDYRVPRNTCTREILPSEPIDIFAAKNDTESFQIILHADEFALSNVKMQIESDLKTESGKTIGKDNVELRYAYYHYVDNPTDTTCARGYYPDALVPISAGADGKGAPLNVAVEQNLPLWVTVKVPNDTEVGRYCGSVKISANDGKVFADVPFAINVWNFAIPLKNTLETAYGMSVNNICRYHNLTTDADKRAVFEKYLKIYSDHRISMYHPAPFDPIVVKWFPKADPPCCEIDFSAFDKEMLRVFEKYHFTNFRLPFLGLGGGTYQSRYEGSIEGYKPDTPEYQAMMADYGKKVQEHLREIGLLDAAYVYSFDEPEEKDYDFVAGEFAKLKKYAPDINRMLTEEPSAKFEDILSSKGTSIDIWCPVSPFYSNETAKRERESGNRFWWYVCCFPKTPYCTEFTDHPALELRLWHWQAFERNISGCLVWEGTYWNSPTAFVDSFQNPYDDPQSYIVDASYPPGTRKTWGNGDGRFVYPPLSAATPGRNDGQPIFDAPCASMRFEMLREGVEDYEMLTILKNKLQEKKASLSVEQYEKYEKLFDFSSITTDMTHFTNDPQRIRARRMEVAKAIEEL